MIKESSKLNFAEAHELANCSRSNVCERSASAEQRRGIALTRDLDFVSLCITYTEVGASVVFSLNRGSW